MDFPVGLMTSVTRSQSQCGVCPWWSLVGFCPWVTHEGEGRDRIQSGNLHIIKYQLTAPYKPTGLLGRDCLSIQPVTQIQG